MPETFSQLITNNDYIKVKKELFSERPIPVDVRNEASQSGQKIDFPQIQLFSSYLNNQLNKFKLFQLALSLK
jgi:hypothetical protein